MTWSLYNQKEELLPPLQFSNGKTQEDVVQEVLAKIREGHSIIFIHGACGTGKSAIALNIAKELGRASIVVPVKYLQAQYREDYTNKLSIKRENKNLTIKILDGRNNHKCLWNQQVHADDKFLPCSIEVKKENIEKIKEFINENPFVNPANIESIDDVRRFTVAPACPYWSPIIQTDYISEGSLSSMLPDATAFHYIGLRNKKFSLLKREPGCTYYEQFQSYLNADVIIFNSKKYEFENLIDRKPRTDVEIIDEGDEFLDSLSNEKKINLHFLNTRAKKIHAECKKPETKEILQEVIDQTDIILNDSNIFKKIQDKTITRLKEAEVMPLFVLFLANEQLTEYEDLEQFYFTAKNFEKLIEDSYVDYYISEKNAMIARIVNINLEKKLKEFTDKNNVFIFMSGTIHTKKVLTEIFGIKEFITIEAETASQGKVKKVYTGLEKNFRYKEFKEKRVTREEYLKALSKCIEVATKPTLVHINSFTDLPTEEEKTFYNLTIISREKLQGQQEKYKQGELLQLFKEKKLDVLYSTKCSRGVDFPGDMCNSIVFTKYPYPNISAIFWKMLRENKPEQFGDFYRDKAHREFLQRMYRGLRSKDDQIEILSPDIMVLKQKIY